MILGLVDRLARDDPAQDTVLENHGTIRERFNRGETLISQLSITVRPGYAAEFFYHLLDILDNSPDLPEPALRLTESIRSGAISDDEFVRASLDDDTRYFISLGRKYDIDLAFLVFVAVYAARPVREPIAARLLRLVDISQWQAGHCPVCSHWPALGLIDPNRRRFLWCNCCDTTWQFSRLKCPFCGTDDQNKLRYLTINDDESRRVDVCDTCRRYIKHRVGETTCNFDYEHLLTYNLDMAVARQGYFQEVYAAVRAERGPGHMQ